MIARICFALALVVAAACANEDDIAFDAGTSDAAVPDLAGDAAPLPVCPAGVESSTIACSNVGAHCRESVSSSIPYICICLCTHTWECDQVAVFCDGGAHD